MAWVHIIGVQVVLASCWPERLLPPKDMEHWRRLKLFNRTVHGCRVQQSDMWPCPGAGPMPGVQRPSSELPHSSSSRLEQRGLRRKPVRSLGHCFASCSQNFIVQADVEAVLFSADRWVSCPKLRRETARTMPEPMSSWRGIAKPQPKAPVLTRRRV